MFSKNTFLVVTTLCLSISAGILGWSHCHDSDSCEDVVNELVSPAKWASMPAEYRLSTANTTGMPPLSDDIAAAHNAWTSIRFQNKNINFRIVRRGTTPDRSDKKIRDNINAVGWGETPAGKTGVVYFGEIPRGLGCWKPIWS